MRYGFLAMGVATLALSACGGQPDEQEGGVATPALELTPGSWSANAEQASFADEAGTLLATFRCDAETGELVLETPGDFAEGVRHVMLLRVGNNMHGIDPVEVRGTGADTVKIGRLPNSGGIVDNLLRANVPMTVETEGGAPVMLETGEALRGFVEGCGGAAAATADQGDAESRSSGS